MHCVGKVEKDTVQLNYAVLEKFLVHASKISVLDCGWKLQKEYSGPKIT